MIKNKGLRFLLSTVAFVALTLTVNFINLAFSSDGGFILGTLSAGVLWLLFLIRSDLLEEHHVYPVRRFLRNLLLVAILAVEAITLLLLTFAFFTSVELGDALAGTLVVTPALTYALLMIFADTDKAWVYSPVTPVLIVAVSGVVGFLVSLLGGLAVIVGIVLAVFSVVITVLAFKNGWVEFIEVSLPKYVPITESSKPAKKNDGSKYHSRYSSAYDAFSGIASRIHRGGTLTSYANYNFSASFEGISAGNASFVITGSVFVSSSNGYSKRDLDYNVDRAFKDMARDIEDACNKEIERLAKDDIGCSASGINFRTSNIRVEFSSMFGLS